MATIRLVGYLKDMAGFHEKEFPLNEPTILRDLVDFPKLKDSRLVVLINEKGAKMDSTITDTDKVKILPVIGGG